MKSAISVRPADAANNREHPMDSSSDATDLFCQSCGYNLATLCTADSPTGHCPECGARYHRSLILMAKRRTFKWLSISWIAIGLAPGVVAALLIVAGARLDPDTGPFQASNRGAVETAGLYLKEAGKWVSLFIGPCLTLFVSHDLAGRRNRAANRRLRMARDVMSTQIFFAFLLILGQVAALVLTIFILVFCLGLSI